MFIDEARLITLVVRSRIKHFYPTNLPGTVQWTAVGRSTRVRCHCCTTQVSSCRSGWCTGTTKTSYPAPRRWGIMVAIEFTYLFVSMILHYVWLVVENKIEPQMSVADLCGLINHGLQKECCLFYLHRRLSSLAVKPCSCCHWLCHRPYEWPCWTGAAGLYRMPCTGRSVRPCHLVHAALCGAGIRQSVLRWRSPSPTCVAAQGLHTGRLTVCLGPRMGPVRAYSKLGLGFVLALGWGRLGTTSI